MRTRAAQVLCEARRLIERPERWCRYAAALDRDGATVLPTDPDAVRWDAIGALAVAITEAGADAATAAAAWRAVVPVPGPVGRRLRLAAVNDELGHAAVLARFDRAIREVA